MHHIVFTTHLPLTDIFTRTLKRMLFERTQHTGKEWHRLLPNLISQYTIHSSTKFRPVDAIEDSNAPDVKQRI